MLEKIERPKKVEIADRMQPKNTEEMIRKYNLEKENIYDYLDKMADYINEKLG